jgi:hypothetical protein
VPPPTSKIVPVVHVSSNQGIWSKLCSCFGRA